MKLYGWPQVFAVIYAPLISIGIFGNILSFYIFRKMKKSAISLLLSALSLCDLLLLFFALPLSCLCMLPIGNMRTLHSIQSLMLIYSTKYLYPPLVAAKTASLYILGAITIERWFAVFKPLQVSFLEWKTNLYLFPGQSPMYLSEFSSNCNYHHSFLLIFNFPRFFEYRIVKNEYGFLDLDHGVLNAKNDQRYFISYHLVLSTLVDYLIPFIAMTVANGQIILELKRIKEQRQLLTISQEKDQNTTKMLLHVTVFFGLCHFFGVAVKVAECIFDRQATEKEPFENFVEISNMCIILHSSATFFIYVMYSSKFNEYLRSVFNKSADNSVKSDDPQPTPIAKDSNQSTGPIIIEMTALI